MILLRSCDMNKNVKKYSVFYLSRHHSIPVFTHFAGVPAYTALEIGNLPVTMEPVPITEFSGIELPFRMVTFLPSHILFTICILLPSLVLLPR